MWRKGNSCALSVGMQVGAATVETSIEFPQKKKKIELAYDLALPLQEIHPKKPETLI